MNLALGSSLIVRELGTQPYSDVWQRMRVFTDSRGASATDEIWLLEHEPVFTLGQAGKAEHLINPGSVPVVKTDRGGQVTYHGPGQLIVYLLIDISRRKIGVRQFVTLLETAVIDCLEQYGIQAEGQDKAPGVYVRGAKIASLGLRVRRGCTYHGLSFNLDMDLTPFEGINVCGYQDLAVTQFSDLIQGHTAQSVRDELLKQLKLKLGYDSLLFVADGEDVVNDK